MILICCLVLAFLTTVPGCAPFKEPEEDLEEPVYLDLDFPAETEVLLINRAGVQHVLTDEASLEDVLKLLDEAILKDEEPEDKAFARLEFTSPGEEVKKVFLFSAHVRFNDSYYKLKPQVLGIIDSFFVPPEIEPVEIAGLVLVRDLDDSIIIDLQYATEDNFTGQVIYPVEVAAIYKKTGEMLVEAQEIFKEKGYRIKLWDAYRPLSAQEVLWEAYPDPRYVHNPEDPAAYEEYGPRHNNGMAVDVTLVDEDGNELKMPTGFDEFIEEAAPGYPDLPEEVRENRDLLIEVMESVGFRVASTEWWHFDDVVNEAIPYLDVPLEAFLEER